jgi:formylglycine-generating enzyme required for sulfatase activity
VLGTIMIDFIQITGNNFLMGDFHGDYLKDSLPIHKVSILDFQISKYPITQEIYEVISGKNPSNFKNRNSPVEMVSWFDCIEFCNKVSERMGLVPCYSKKGEEIACFFENNGFRLPTEAEWEYAAREGEMGNKTKYSVSVNLSHLEKKNR